jgi:endonuclease III related protein
MKINKIYKLLLKNYGDQGWWPLINDKFVSEYKKRDKIIDNQRFEIIIGSILVQNTSWANAEKGIISLKKNKLLKPNLLYGIAWGIIAPIIKSSGYYNQKAKTIMFFLEWFKGYNFNFENLNDISTHTIREELLSIKGIGPETADTILLYAFCRKIFVVDTYTCRVFSRIGLFKENLTYSQVQSIFHENFTGEIQEYKEYHSLIVKHAKEYCLTLKRIKCKDCFLLNSCEFNDKSVL